MQITLHSINQIIEFLKNEVAKKGFSKVIMGLSGGIDSAVVALLCKRAFEDNLKVILLPSSTSSKSSIEDALELCEKFTIKYEIISIAKFDEIFRSTFMQSDNISKGNFCARMRMAMLYHKSYEERRLVIGTSNKSELMLGYGTMFGDLACAINPIGSFYKFQIYEMAKLLNITPAILNKAPSADFYEGQSDENELGYKYAQIDPFLIDYEKNMPFEILKTKYDEKMIEKIIHRIKTNSFKMQGTVIYKP